MNALITGATGNTNSVLFGPPRDWRPKAQNSSIPGSIFVLNSRPPSIPGGNAMILNFSGQEHHEGLTVPPRSGGKSVEHRRTQDF